MVSPEAPLEYDDPPTENPREATAPKAAASEFPASTVMGLW